MLSCFVFFGVRMHQTASTPHGIWTNVFVMFCTPNFFLFTTIAGLPPCPFLCFTFEMTSKSSIFITLSNVSFSLSHDSDIKTSSIDSSLTKSRNASSLL